MGPVEMPRRGSGAGKSSGCQPLLTRRLHIDLQRVCSATRVLTV